MPAIALPRPRPRSRRTRSLAVVLLGALGLGIAITAWPVIQPDPLRAPAGLALGDPLGADDGFIETGEHISPFADDLPALARLTPALREAMQTAATAALADGVEFVVTSGWRSERYQRSLFDDAVREYGDAAEARRWVAAVDSSAHVTGDAVDIGFTDANSWLSQHGAEYGLCQTYANEMWHFELSTTPGGECPSQLPDAG